MQTHTSYTTSKKLKAFLGESAPEAIEPWAYDPNIKTKGPWKFHEEERRKTDCPAYKLHDLLSRPFCEAMGRKTVKSHWGVMSTVGTEYYEGGLPAVEAAICKMMEDK